MTLPLKFCTSLNSALRAIEKLWEMKSQVRVFSKTFDERAFMPGTRATDYFLCIVKPPHQTPFDRPSRGSSPTEAIARAIADFIDKETTLIRWYAYLLASIIQFHLLKMLHASCGT